MPDLAERLSHASPRISLWQRTLLLAPSADLGNMNTRAIYIDYALGYFTITIVLNFLPVFAVRLGASDLLVGALTSGPYLVALLFSLPAARLVADKKRLIHSLVVAVIFHRFAFLMFALIPSVVSRFQAEALVFTNLLSGIPFSVLSVGFFTMFAYAVPPEQRAHVMSRRFSIGSLTSMLGLLLAGFWLEGSPFPFNYQMLFLASSVIGLGSAWYLSRIRLSSGDAPSNGSVSPSWRARWAQIKGQRRFVRFAVCATATNLTVTMLTPLYPILLVNRLGASDGWISILLTIYTATSVVAALWMDRVLRWWGTRQTLAWSGVGMGVYCALLVIAPSVASLIPIHIFAGIVIIGFSVALPNGLVEACPEENRADFTALYMILVNIAVFAGPLLGSAFSTAFGMLAAILIVGVLRTGAGLLFLWLES